MSLAPGGRSQSMSAFLTNQIEQHFSMVLWVIGHRHKLTTHRYSANWLKIPATAGEIDLMKSSF